MMEKRGVVATDVTKDVECRLSGGKTAADCESQQSQVQDLDDDLTKRAAERAQQRLAQ